MTCPGKAGKPFALSKSRARRLWLRAQRLDEYAPFRGGPEATRAAVRKLGPTQQLKEQNRDQRGIPLLEELARDLRLSLREHVSVVPLTRPAAAAEILG